MHFGPCLDRPQADSEWTVGLLVASCARFEHVILGGRVVDALLHESRD